MAKGTTPNSDPAEIITSNKDGKSRVEALRENICRFQSRLKTSVSSMTCVDWCNFLPDILCDFAILLNIIRAASVLAKRQTIPVDGLTVTVRQSNKSVLLLLLLPLVISCLNEFNFCCYEKKGLGVFQNGCFFLQMGNFKESKEHLERSSYCLSLLMILVDCSNLNVSLFTLPQAALCSFRLHSN